MGPDYFLRFSGWFMLLLALGVNSACFAAEPIADGEGEDLGRQLEKHLAVNNAEFYANAFDLDALLEHTVGGNPKGSDFQESVADFKQNFHLQIVHALTGAIESKFLHTRRVDGELRVVMRLSGPDAALNYHELILERDAQGKPKIVDAFVYATGEKFSDTLRREMLPLVTKDQRSVTQHFLGTEPDLVKYERQVLQLRQLQSPGSHQEFMKIYNQLPPSLQRERFILAMRLKMFPNDPDYPAALELWRGVFPRDPSTDLMSLNFFYDHKQYAEALASAEQLNQTVGGDPRLDFQCAKLLVLTGEPAKAREAAHRAWEQEPKFLEPALLEFGLLADEQKYDECFSLLYEVMAKGGLSKGTLQSRIMSLKEFPDILRTQQFRKWVAARPGSTGLSSNPSSARQVPVAAGARSSTSQELKLEGVLYSKARPSATINGQFVMVGDKIQNYTVLAIEQTAVTLQSSAGDKKVLRLNTN